MVVLEAGTAMSDAPLIAQPPVIELRVCNGGPVLWSAPIDLLLLAEIYRGRLIGLPAAGQILELRVEQAHASARFVYVQPDRSEWAA